MLLNQCKYGFVTMCGFKDRRWFMWCALSPVRHTWQIQVIQNLVVLGLGQADLLCWISVDIALDLTINFCFCPSLFFYFSCVGVLTTFWEQGVVWSLYFKRAASSAALEIYCISVDLIFHCISLHSRPLPDSWMKDSLLINKYSVNHWFQKTCFLKVS